MARKEYVITIFVASPSDVMDERNKLEEVIRELNSTWGRDQGIRIDLVRWETNAFPGISDDPQKLINEQIPNDYDCLIGIMWHRFGTPTPRASSGTLEEYQTAKKRYENDSSSIKIMFYFKNQPIAPSEVDSVQLKEVMDFQKSLGKEGILYWKFENIDDFERLIRLHLSRQFQEWRKKFNIIPNINVNDAEKNGEVHENDTQESDYSEHEDEDSLGILDLVDIFEKEFNNLSNITERMSTAGGEFTENINKRTEEIQNISKFSQGAEGRGAARRLIARTALDMDMYRARLEPELPMFRRSLNAGMDSFIKVFAIQKDFQTESDEKESVKQSLEAVTSLRKTLEETGNAIRSFRDTVSHLPRMTGELNRAKRALVDILDDLVSSVEAGLTLVKEAENEVVVSTNQ